eukprot:1040237-Pyramimonas_sp.AAC.1
MIAAPHFDETGKPKPPGDPLGGPGDEGGPGGDGGRRPNGPGRAALQPCIANPMDLNWRTVSEL